MASSGATVRSTESPVLQPANTEQTTTAPLAPLSNTSLKKSDLPPAPSHAVVLTDEQRDELKKWREMKADRSALDQRMANQAEARGKPPVVADDVKADFSNPFTRPGVEDLVKMGWYPESNAVCTAQEITNITADLIKVGVPRATCAKAIWSFCRYLADVGTSPYLNPDGTDGEIAGNILRDSFAAVIKGQKVELRRFARTYAPIVFEMMLQSKIPPANWMAQGFHEDHRYAGFDFFDGTLNEAAIRPRGTITRKPTNGEIVAWQTRKKIALDKARSSDTSTILVPEITGGKMGCKPKLNIAQTHCS